MRCFSRLPAFTRASAKREPSPSIGFALPGLGHISSRLRSYLALLKLISFTMAAKGDLNYDSSAETEKMSVPSDTDASSTRSIPVPIATEELVLEKTASKATQRTTRSGRSNRAITTAQDWEGPDDPDNPLNWPTSKKIYHTVIPALQCFTMYETSDLCHHIANLSQHFWLFSLYSQRS